MVGAGISWLASDRGLLVVGTSLLLGGLGCLWADCLRLWRMRRRLRDMVDLLSTTAFTALIAGIAMAEQTYDSLLAVTVGLAAASLSGFVLRRALRVGAEHQALLLVFALVVSSGLTSSGLVARDAPDPVRTALARRIDEARQGTGAVVGLLTPEGRSFAVYGRVRIDGPEPTPDTIVEIGSIGKVFTAFLLADMVERGEVALEDPVRKYLPASVTVPSFGGKDISLVDLATHTSGLPRDSVAVDLESDRSPYAGYTADELYAFIGRYRLEHAPGARWEYSNVGMGLLGHALALRAGAIYEDLVRRQLFDPLGMMDTRIAFDAEQSARRATGYNPKLIPGPLWTGGVIAPTGGFSSTAADLMKFGADVLNPDSPRRAVYARMTSVKRPGSGRRVQQTLGWELFRLGPNEIIAHNGGTFGFEARLLVDTTRKRVVVAWANSRSGNGVINLAGAAIDQARLQ